MNTNEPSTSTTSAKSRRSHNRVQPLLDAAAMLFATKGYKETTMRDIGSEIDMLPGSVYYHFKSKQELLIAVYENAVDSIQQRLLAAVEEGADPWDNLQAAVISHIECILDHDDYAHVMVGVIPARAPELKKELIKLRDRYENVFAELIDELPLKEDVDRKLLRLMLLGSMNTIQNWFHEGQDSPEQIGRQFVGFLRNTITLE